MSNSEFKLATHYSAVVASVLAGTRRKFGYSIGAVAQLLEISVSTLKRMESGSANVTMEQIAILSKLFRLKPIDIMQEADLFIQRLESKGVLIVDTRDQLQAKISEGYIPLIDDALTEAYR